MGFLPPDERDAIRDEWNQLHYKLEQRAHLPAKLGDGAGNIFVTDQNGNQIQGYVWARIQIGGNPTIRKVRNFKTGNAYGADVFVRLDPTGEYTVVGSDPASATQYYNGFAINDTGSHGVNHGLYAPDPVFLDSQQIIPLATRLTQTPSLFVRLEAGWYYINGEKAFWGGGNVDLSLYVPDNSGEQRIVIVALNAATNIPIVYPSTVITSGTTPPQNPFTWSDVLAISTGDLIIESSAVRLYHGMTAFGLADIFADLRPFFTVGAISVNPATDRQLVDDNGNVLVDDNGNILVDDL